MAIAPLDQGKKSAAYVTAEARAALRDLEGPLDLDHPIQTAQNAGRIGVRGATLNRQ